MTSLPFRAALAGLVVMLSSALGGAETAGVTGPVLVDDPGARFPERALAARFYSRVDVVLRLELDAEGNVVQASVETPLGYGFDEAALEAARRLRFEPARRAGKAIAARIRYRYTFQPPEPTLAGSVVDAGSGAALPAARLVVDAADAPPRSLVTDADGTWPPLALPRGAARVTAATDRHLPQEIVVTLVPGAETRVEFRLEPKAPLPEQAVVPVLEVTVRGERAAPSVRSYSRAEVRQIPGAFGDPFRALETLPGVTAVASGVPFFYVRGAPPGNVGYFLDGVRVPYLYHVGLGPSVVQPALVERVDLYTGGYPARFGRFAGGIVSATTTEPRPELHGEANLRLFDVGGLVETGFDGERGSVLVGGRYSYTAALISLFAPELTLDYRDYQARVTYDVTPRDRISLFGFGAYDLLAREKNGVLNVLFGTEFYRGKLGYDHRWAGGALKNALTLGYDRTSAGALAGEQRNVSDRSLAASSELHDQLGRDLRLRAGADLTLDAYQVEPPRYRDPDHPEARRFDEQFPARTDLAYGVWIDLSLAVAPGVEVVPGLRADVYQVGSTRAFALDPRLAARFSVGPSVRIVHAHGLTHQTPSFAVPLPGLAPASLEDGLQRSFQTSAGVEVDLDDATLASAGVFQNAFFAMSDALGTSAGDGPPDFSERSQGAALGVELLLKRRLTRRLGGVVSYTLSRSSRSAGRERFVSAFDRTHVANAAATCDLGRNWRTGGRAVFYTGTPEQPASAGTIAPPRSRSPARTPPFLRLDVRLEKRWNLDDTRWIAFVVEVMNATLAKETFGNDEIGPLVIPSLGVEAGF